MPENNNFSQYSWFREKKTELSTMMDDSSKIIDQLSMNKFANRLKQLSEKVANDTFKIQIVGTFKNGKSTFINALLGEDILPTRTLPCTAVVNEVRYGETKHAILNFVNPLPEHLLESIPTPTLQHMKKYMKDGKPVPPMEIEYDHMEKYVTIPLDGDPEEISAMSPYKSVELFYPSPFLKEGVVIVDSPGLNESPSRTKVTLEYLDEADAIIYLFDSLRVCAQDEMETIEDLLIPKGFKDMFFVVNRFDLVNAKERPQIKEFVEKKVGHYSSRPIFCISALKGVEGKVEHDDAKYAESGMEPFEKALSEFLTKEKGRIKLAQPARELNEILSKEILFKTIPSQRKQLDTSLTTLQARYDAAKPQLEELQSRKQQLMAQMSLRIEQSQNEVRRAVLEEHKELANSIPAWVDGFTPKTGIGFGQKSRVKKIVDEIVTFITEKTKEKGAEWNKNVLQPLIKEKAQYIFDSADRDLTEIFNSIDEVSGQITGEKVEIGGPAGWERVAGFATMMFFGSTGASMMVGGVGNGKSIVTHLATDIGVGAGLVLLGVVNPVLTIAAIVGLIAKGFIDGGSSAMKDVKKKVANAIADSIRNEAPEKAKEITEQFKTKLDKIAESADDAIDVQIDNVKSQVESIMHDIEQGQDKVDERKALLEKSEHDLQEIHGKLDKLVFDLAGLA